MALFSLLAYSTLIFFTTFFLGFIPLSLSRSISPIRHRQLSIIGVGLLVGVALTVIIPEGIEAIYQTQSINPNHPNHHHHHHPPIGLALLSGFLLMFLIDQASSPDPIPIQSHPSNSPSTPSSTSLVTQPEINTLNEANPTAVLTLDSNHGSYTKPLVATCSHTNSSHKSLLSTTLGLLTHSLADGISLGASSTFNSLPATAHASSKDVPALDLIVFLAIIVHKAPVAFGLVAVLMSEGIPRHLIRRILFAFSLATPLGSLITWSFITTLMAHQTKHDPHDSLPHSRQASMQWWIGMTLLFSGGTFLFIAIHAMQHSVTEQVTHYHSTPSSSLIMSEGHQTEDINHQAVSTSTPTPQMGRLMTSLLMVSGMMAPSILTKIFGHGH
ncbi:ZIP zinc transporter-domain-containing protein [Melampsora americana]|nr:ZIP zinc transporter-domain-containing protein [Melampsora americana]